MRAGEMDVVFALRYEPADETVRGHGLEILALRWPGLVIGFGPKRRR